MGAFYRSRFSSASRSIEMLVKTLFQPSSRSTQANELCYTLPPLRFIFRVSENDETTVIKLRFSTAQEFRSSHEKISFLPGVPAHGCGQSDSPSSSFWRCCRRRTQRRGVCSLSWCRWQQRAGEQSQAGWTERTLHVQTTGRHQVRGASSAVDDGSAG